MRSELPHRWLVLALASLLLMGAYYCFDIPAALYSHFASAFSSEMTAASYAMVHNVLYTAYALPNLALPLFAGYLVDAFGAHAVIAVLCATLAAGQALLSAGVLLKSVTLLVVGRVLFGVGGESVVVAQSAVVTEWFRGGELGERARLRRRATVRSARTHACRQRSPWASPSACRAWAAC